MSKNHQSSLSKFRRQISRHRLETFILICEYTESRWNVNDQYPTKSLLKICILSLPVPRKSFILLFTISSSDNSLTEYCQNSFLIHQTKIMSLLPSPSIFIHLLYITGFYQTFLSNKSKNTLSLFVVFRISRISVLRIMSNLWLFTLIFRFSKKKFLRS